MPFMRKNTRNRTLDKVVKQLEDRSTLARPVGWTKQYEIVTLKDAIEIVKGRGLDKC